MEPTIIISERVVPHASRTQCESRDDEGAYRNRVQAVPEKGKANKALVQFLAKRLRIGRGRITLISGETARTKRLEIQGLTESEIDVRLLEQM